MNFICCLWADLLLLFHSWKRSRGETLLYTYNIHSMHSYVYYTYTFMYTLRELYQYPDSVTDMPHPLSTTNQPRIEFCTRQHSCSIVTEYCSLYRVGAIFWSGMNRIATVLIFCVLKVKIFALGKWYSCKGLALVANRGVSTSGFKGIDKSIVEWWSCQYKVAKEKAKVGGLKIVKCCLRENSTM